MTAEARPAVPNLLLVEPESLMRGTVAAVARQEQLAAVREATSVRAAERLLGIYRFEMMLIALDTEGQGLKLIADLRQARFPGGEQIALAVMTGACDRSLVDSLKALEVRKVVLKPFKARTLLETIADLRAAWSNSGIAA